MYWSYGEETVDLLSFQGQMARYNTWGAGTDWGAYQGASAWIYPEWDAQFKLSHSPCEDVSTPTPTATETLPSTPTPSKTITPTLEIWTDTPSPSPPSTVTPTLEIWTKTPETNTLTPTSVLDTQTPTGTPPIIETPTPTLEINTITPTEGTHTDEELPHTGIGDDFVFMTSLGILFTAAIFLSRLARRLI